MQRQRQRFRALGMLIPVKEEAEMLRNVFIELESMQEDENKYNSQDCYKTRTSLDCGAKSFYVFE